MKRITVSRMLKQRLANAKASLKISYQYEDVVKVMGGDSSKECQHRVNMESDIGQLEFLIEQLEKFRQKGIMA